LTLLAAAHALWLADQGQTMRGVLRFAGRVLLAIGTLGVCLATNAGFGFFVWLILLGIAWRAASHFRAAQKRSLLAALALAADRQMPLAPMAEAFAAEGDGAFAYRVRQLAAKLKAGMTLPDAVTRSWGVLPSESVLAARVGEATGDLAGALRATTFNQVFDRALLRPVLVRMWYIFPVTALFYFFFLFKIVPSYVKIFEDFDMMLPPITIAVLSSWPSKAINLSGLWRLSGNIDIVVVVGLITLASIALFSALYVVVWLQWRGVPFLRVPWLTRIITWVEMGPVLRVLALAASWRHPLSRSLVTLGRFHPKRAVRERLWAAVRDIDEGQPWHVSLRQMRLISAADEAVLAAAERSNNLVWALEEMAASFERRANYRLQALAQIVLPLILLPVGLMVATLVVALFLPIVVLIESLT
jgi:type IV pilus assembly protein PilC